MIPEATLEPTDNQESASFSKDSSPDKKVPKPQNKNNTQLQQLQLHLPRIPPRISEYHQECHQEYHQEILEGKAHILG
jgi:hypothetical protein